MLLPLQDFLSKCKKPADAVESGPASMARGRSSEPYLTQPATLPELKAREGGERQEATTGSGYGGGFGGRGGGYGGGRGGGFTQGRSFGGSSGVGAAGLAGALDRRVDAVKVYKWVCTTGKRFFAAHLSGGAAGIDSRHASVSRNAGFGIVFRRFKHVR